MTPLGLELSATKDRAGHHLILGGTGFIGRHVATLLAEAGVAVVMAGPRRPAFRLPDGVRWTPFDLATADWRALIEQAAVVHHYAWTTVPATATAAPIDDLDANVRPTVALLEAMRGAGRSAPRLVFTSSGGSVYGRLQRVPADEHHPLAPINAYAAGKVAAEVYLGLYRALYGLDCRIARVANPFGADQHPGRGLGAATMLARRALAGEPLAIWGDGSVVRDFIHVSDAARALVTLALCDLPGGEWIFNIGSGRGTSLVEIVAVLERALRRRLPVSYGPARSIDVPVSVLDCARARRDLGWEARLTFEDGMRSTLDELKSARVRADA